MFENNDIQGLSLKFLIMRLFLLGLLNKISNLETLHPSEIHNSKLHSTAAIKYLMNFSRLSNRCDNYAKIYYRYLMSQM